MSLNYKNALRLREENTGKDRREELAMEPLVNSGMFPDTVLLEDIDTEFKKWVETELYMNFEDKDIPTVALFSSQRFSEYMQSWKDVDDKKNFLMNFKVITRDNNPKPGTLYGDVRNIPGEQKYSVQRYVSVDENGRKVILDYKIKQPYCVDIVYNVSVVTNKLRMLNLANELINDKFKSITSYINVKGHYMPMNLGEISDESDYEIDDRQYFSQTFNITVKGYIINENSMEVEEKPLIKYSCIEKEMEDKIGTWAQIEEEPKRDGEEFLRESIKIQIDRCKTGYSFDMPYSMIFDELETDNIRHFNLKAMPGDELEYNINDEHSINLKIMEGARVFITKVVKMNVLARPGTITLSGYRPYDLIEK